MGDLFMDLIPTTSGHTRRIKLVYSGPGLCSKIPRIKVLRCWCNNVIESTFTPSFGCMMLTDRLRKMYSGTGYLHPP